MHDEAHSVTESVPVENRVTLLLRFKVLTFSFLKFWPNFDQMMHFLDSMLSKVFDGRSNVVFKLNAKVRHTAQVYAASFRKTKNSLTHTEG